MRFVNAIVYFVSWYWVMLFVPIVPTPNAYAEGNPSNNGLIIGEVSVKVEDIFLEDEEGLLYDIANRLKVNTKRDIIKRELLFREGDSYDSFVIDESARNLRSLPFVRNIRFRERVNAGRVDIQVIVQDAWTFFPILAIASGGGSDKKSVGVTEGNLLGYGKRIEGLLTDEDGQSTYELVFDDRRFLGSLQRFTTGHFERSDGRNTVLSWGLPFRSLVNKEAWFIDVANSDLVNRLYSETQERYIFRKKHSQLHGGYTWSQGEPADHINRFTLGYSYTNDAFSEADDEDYVSISLSRDDLHPDGGILAPDRRFSGPSLSYQRIKPDFLSLNYVDSFDRYQDFNLGNEFVANVQLSPEAMGSDDDAFIIRMTDTDGLRISDQAFLRGQVSLQTRYLNGESENTIYSFSGRFYQVNKPSYLSKVYLGQHTFAVAIGLRGSLDLDDDKEFLLGAGNSLRGYEDRTFTGKHLFFANLEDRVHLVDEVFKLVSLGGAVFADVGSVSRESFGDVFVDQLYADVGVGLRFGLIRSSGGAVVRVDLAVPVRDGPDGSQKFEPRLLITTGQLFSAFLRSDAPGLTTPSISAGFSQ